MYQTKKEKLYDMYLFYQSVVTEGGDIDGCPFNSIESCINYCGVFFPNCIRDGALDGCECPCHYYGQEEALDALKDVLLKAGYFI
jgi:hypothetical protein